ncbi:hypothetical protein AAVH_03388 [Aphelenchoides avenae]|nr:hypothetical protein AAVH_03388 [Aphelenchus avenae]
MSASKQEDLESRTSTPESSSTRAAKRKANEKLDSRSATPNAQTPVAKQEGKPKLAVTAKKEPVTKEQQCEVEKILDRKAHANGSKLVYLVQWRKKDDGGKAKEDSWESKSKISSISAHARKLLKDFELEADRKVSV